LLAFGYHHVPNRSPTWHAYASCFGPARTGVRRACKRSSVLSGENFPVCPHPWRRLAQLDHTTRLHSFSTPAGKHYDVWVARMTGLLRLAFLPCLSVIRPRPCQRSSVTRTPRKYRRGCRVSVHVGRVKWSLMMTLSPQEMEETEDRYSIAPDQTLACFVAALVECLD
jgi:hypothetical protein